MKSQAFTLRGRELPLYVWILGYIEFLWHTLGPGFPVVGLFTVTMATLAAVLTYFQRGPEWKTEANGLISELLRLRRESWFQASCYIMCFALFSALLALTLYSSLRPPFLPQEYDLINYQMGVPRQLLIRKSLGWIDWSVADLWPMAMQWGMAPLSLALGTINKLPQFLFSLGGALCMYRIAGQLLPQQISRLAQALPCLVFFSAHGVAIQLGTGMMDLPALYLLLLCLTSLLEKRYVIAALSLAVYVSSKAFHPFQIAAVLTGGLAWLAFAGSGGEKGPIFTRFLPALAIFSVLLLARSASISIEATGTPLFPFGACRLGQAALCTPEKREILEQSAAQLLSTRDKYGLGRGPLAFFEHLWRVSVPTRGVNNEYDYPLGLSWILMLVLLAFSGIGGKWRHPLLQLALAFWVLWWLNSHQSRWLYPVLAFGLLATIPMQLRAQRVLPPLIAISFAFTLLSQYRSLAPTIRMSAGAIIEREEAKVRWSPDGRLESAELLYVNKPAQDHIPGGRLWILR